MPLHNVHENQTKQVREALESGCSTIQEISEQSKWTVDVVRKVLDNLLDSEDIIEFQTHYFCIPPSVPAKIALDWGQHVQAEALNAFSERCHEANKTWWHDPKTGERLQLNDGERFMLMVSEISEAMEGHRKNLMDDKLPHRKMVEVELADCLIRIFDYAGANGLDLGGAFVEKMAYNAVRADHKPEHRLSENGKKY